MVKFLSCTQSCPGQPQSARVSRSFRHHRSHVEVIIQHIPVSVCPECGRSFVEEATIQHLEALLESFHSPQDSQPGKFQLDFETELEQDRSSVSDLAM